VPEVYPRGPPHLATDEALVIDALKDLLQTLPGRRVRRRNGSSCLNRTCPLRAADDVRDCLKLVGQGGYDSVATFKDADLNPHRAWRLVDGVPEVFIEAPFPGCPGRSCRRLTS